MMNRMVSFRSAAVLSLAMAGLGGLAGCESTAPVGPVPSFDISASRNSAVVGETVTITSQSMNVAGSESEIRWHVSGGDVELRQDGRVAQVTFDEAGTYTVSANLISDGEQVMSDTTTIMVRPIGQGPAADRDHDHVDVDVDVDDHDMP